MSTYDDVMDTTPDKGKGKLQDDTIADPVTGEEEESSEDDEEVDEHALPIDDVEHDALEEIDASNIVSGSRTRTKPVINYAEVDQTGLDDEDDDDEDFQEKPAVEEHDADKMEH
ncbi:hypothetical protein TWF281_005581 [Arthrobotrys megalospora]